MSIAYVLLAVAVLAVGLLVSSVRVITQFERGVVFRFGQLRPEIRGPGLEFIVPVVDRLQKVNMQIITQPVPRRTASPGTPAAANGMDPVVMDGIRGTADRDLLDRIWTRT